MGLLMLHSGHLLIGLNSFRRAMTTTLVATPRSESARENETMDHLEPRLIQATIANSFSANRSSGHITSGADVAKSIPYHVSLASQRKERPKLGTLVANNKIIGDVDGLMDFAIIGFAKTGTTKLTQWLAEQPEIAMNSKEVHFLTTDQPAEMARHLYRLQPAKVKAKRGYKAPRDVADPNVLDLLDQYWPQAKLIVGLRHPVEWFQSLYNFKLRANITLPPPQALIGYCDFQFSTMEEIRLHRISKYNGMADNGVCTDLARFHVSLSMMGKTNISDPNEEILLGARKHQLASRAPIRNPIFLYEVGQRSDPNTTRVERFHEDLKDYLGLAQNLSSLPNGKPGETFNQNYHSSSSMLDICEDKHIQLRKTLMEHGADASSWILDYFIKNPDVVVSQREYFVDLLNGWRVDPCTLRKTPT